MEEHTKIGGALDHVEAKEFFQKTATTRNSGHIKWDKITMGSSFIAKIVISCCVGIAQEAGILKK